MRFSQVLKRDIQQHVDSRSDLILKGGLSHEEYKNQCGVLYGLRLALRELEALQPKDEDEDE
jgi:hypothetical protein